MAKDCGCKVGLKEIVWTVGLCVTIGGIMMGVGQYRLKVDQNTKVSEFNVPQLEKDMIVVKEQGKYITQKVDEISEAVSVLAAQRYEAINLAKRKKKSEVMTNN